MHILLSMLLQNWGGGCVLAGTSENVRLTNSNKSIASQCHKKILIKKSTYAVRSKF